ncbi:MAG TPA: methionyl-tRNA formyltransferase [Candidatus Dojkabacteria bacterium]|nr:methionyl-tRNA formyltransferase [Candidatus Dojkabacteria bacterium]
MKIKTLFLGTGWQSLETLKSLFNDSRFEIIGIITQPDKPVGRKQELTPSDVKKFGLENNIPVFHTEKLKEKYQEALDLFKPELIVCIAFGEIVPEFFLEYPKYKSINIHFSLLPKYRGAVPIQMAILKGEKITGISIVQMVQKLDAGPILKEYEEEIFDTDTNQTLRERLVKKGSEVLPDVLEQWCKGEIKAKEQDEAQATYCYEREIAKEQAQINFETMDAQYIERMVRAFIPWPVVWCMLNNIRVKIFEAKVVEDIVLKPGEIKVSENRLIVGTKEKSIEFLKLQPEGKTVMDVKQYLAGKKI